LSFSSSTVSLRANEEESDVPDESWCRPCLLRANEPGVNDALLHRVIDLAHVLPRARDVDGYLRRRRQLVRDVPMRDGEALYVLVVKTARRGLSLLHATSATSSSYLVFPSA
jgi:hypothetical protein